MHVLGDEGVLDCGEFLSLHSAEATARLCSGSARSSVAPPGLSVGSSSECGVVRKIGSGQINLGRNLNWFHKCTNNFNILHVLGEGVLGRGDFFCCCSVEAAPGLSVVAAPECGVVSKIGSGEINLGTNLNWFYKCTSNLNILHVLGEGVLGRGDFFCWARARFVRRVAASADEWSCWVAVSTLVLGVCILLVRAHEQSNPSRILNCGRE